MRTWTDRLVELGITLPPVAEPVGGYTPATRSGLYVYTSGQLPFVGGTLPATGKVGAGVDVTQAAGLARTAALNALAAVDALVGLDAVIRVVKVTGFVASSPSFTGQAQVINGASAFLHEIFGPAGVHARSAVGVAVLPLDSPVELELQVEIGS
jgi:enamine deaminase RidA (YjgF/YER057c/UK114 family)